MSGRGARALLALVALAGCATTRAVDGPIVRGAVPGVARVTPPARLTVVSWNVHLGAEPEGLARALVAGGLGDADVYLIQEIEDHWPGEPRPRAEALAAALGAGFVYAPARTLGHGGLGSHGLAVLSRWPIVDDVVLHLPYHDLLWNARPRIALGVTIDVAGTAVQVWNVHLDTRIAVEERAAQLAPVFERARALPGLAIVGGDLNTWAPVHERVVDGMAAREGYATPTAGLSDTVTRRFPATRLDALYTRGFAVLGAGVDRDVGGSDHRPIWVQVAWPRRPR